MTDVGFMKTKTKRARELVVDVKPLRLSDKHKASVLRRLNDNIKPGKPQPGTKVTGDCELWTGCQVSGYGQLRVGGKLKYANRIACEIYNNIELPPELQVRHLCANPLCVARAHLVVGTAQDNANDKVESGRSLAGENSPAATITADIAKAIYNNSASLTQKELAVLYSCSEQLVRTIHSGRAWCSVTGATNQKRTAVKRFELEIKDEEEARQYVKDRVQLLLDNENNGHTHWIWQSKRGDGYGQAAFRGKRYLAHIFSWRAFNKCAKIKKGECVLHGCRRKDCVNPEGLRVGTCKENMADKVRDGTDGRGTKNKRAKLTEEKVYEIRRLHSKGASSRTIAERFRVSQAAINAVVSGRNWNHLVEKQEAVAGLADLSGVAE